MSKIKYIAVGLLTVYIAGKLTKSKVSSAAVKSQAIANGPALKPSSSAQTTKPNGKLQINVLLRTSGTEKFFSSEDSLKDKALNMARSMVPALNKGPIPKILTIPTLTAFKDVDSGYQVSFLAGALFHSGAKNLPVKPDALDYISKVLRSNKDFGDRVLQVRAAKVA